MKVKTVRVELELDDGNFNQKVIKASASMDKLGDTTEKAGRQIDRTAGKTRGFGTVLRDATIVAGLARSAIHNLHAVTSGWMLGIIQSNAEIERMTMLLQGMSSQMGETAKIQEANEQMAWLFDMAERAPFTINALSDSFVKMKSVGLDPMAGSMEALTNAVANFGGDNNVLHRASIAIQQMAGKGVISMEELRQQLGEAVPNAMRLMARSMGLTMGELVDQVSSGTVEAKSALAKMFGEFEREFAGSAQRMMTTWNGLVSRMQTRWTLLMKEVGDAGYFDAAKAELEELVDLMGDPNVQSFAKDLGAGLAQLIKWIKEAITFVAEYRHELKELALVAATVFGVSKALKWGKALVGVFTGLSGGAVKAARGLKTFATGMTTAGSAATVARGALGVFGKGLLALLGPIGVIGGALWTLYDVWQLFTNKRDSATDSIMDGFITKRDVELTRENAEIIKNELEELQAKREAVNTKYHGWGEEDRERKRAAERSRLDKEIADLEEKLKKTEEAIDKATATITDREAQKLIAGSEKELEKTLQEVSDAHRKVAQQYEKDLADIVNSKDYDQKEKDEGRKQLKAVYEEDLVESYDRQIAIIEKAIERETFALNNGEAVRKKAAETQLKNLKERQRELEEAKKKGLDVFRMEVEQMGGTSDKQTPYEKMLQRLEVGLAKTNAKADETGQKLAEVRALINKGALGDLTDDQEKNILALADAWDKAIVKQKNATKATREHDQATDWLKNTQIELEAETRAVNAAFADPTGHAQSQAMIRLEIQLNKQLLKVKEELREEARKEADDILAKTSANETKRKATEMREETRRLRIGLMNRRQAAEEEYRIAAEKARRELDMKHLTDEERIEAERILNEHLKALRDKRDRDQESAIDKMLREWSDVTEQMEQAGARWLDSFSDKMVDAMLTGKASFSDFAESVIRDIAKIIIQAQMAEMLGGSSGGGIGGFFGSIFSSIGSAIFGGGGAADTTINTPTATLHGGGIAGREAAYYQSVPNSLFDNAKKFHSGGMPGLRSDEVPAILEKGEGVFTKEQMRAMGGMATPEIEINVINQSGQQVNAQQNQPRFDGRKMILDVVLTAMQHPGQFRDGMKSAVGA
jgi:tape measure domain-containing protein